MCICNELAAITHYIQACQEVSVGIGNTWHRVKISVNCHTCDSIYIYIYERMNMLMNHLIIIVCCIIIIIIIKRIFFKCRAVKKKLLEHFTEVKQLMTMSHVRVCEKESLYDSRNYVKMSDIP